MRGRGELDIQHEHARRAEGGERGANEKRKTNVTSVL